jgi:PKD repeat protein
VTLKLTNDGGSASVTKSAAVNVSPSLATVSFTASPLSGAFPLSVTFTDTSLGTVNSRLWDFGDGQTSTDVSPVHVYTSAGQYTVSLTDTNAGGSSSSTIPNMITATNSPPTAVFSGTPLTGATPLTVNFTNSSPGVNNSYAWDFNNDGTPDSTALNPSATFTTPGVYSVRLTATNDGGSNSQLRTGYITVTNIAPVADFGGSPTIGPVGMTVSFNDASTGVVTTRLWDFGDGQTSTLTNPTHTYATHGDFTVSLTATNDGGSNTKTRTNFVSTKYPIQVADFTGTPLSGAVPMLVTFTNTTTGTAGTWLWNFGDGTPTSTLQNPTHSYTTPGTYNVSLTATNDGGSHTRTRTNYVAATLAVPVANFTASPTTGYIPQTVTFTDTSTGTRTAWLWDFGDGTTSAVQNPTKTYSVAGTYTIKLTATNSSGSNQKTSTNMLTFTSLNYNYMDPANKGAGMVLSNNNLTLTAASDGIVIGKYPFTVTGTPGSSVYWEMHINTRGSGIWFGLVRAGHPLTAGSYPGQRTNDFSLASDGGAWTGGGRTDATFLTPNWAANALTDLGLRLDAMGAYSAALNDMNGNAGVGAAWFGGGAIPPGTYYPCIRLTGGASVTLNFGPTMNIRNYGVWTS